MKLSIIIGCLNDAVELNHTIRSILDTAPDNPEIIVIDDCSSCPVWIDKELEPHVVILHNRHRCGVGPSRHIGITRARADWLLIIDSHMRFSKGWYEPFERMIEPGEHDTVWCASCLELNANNMDPEKAGFCYNGATYNWYGPDRHNPKVQQVLECVWLPRDQEPKDGDEIPAVMGACYFVSRSWFRTIDPLRNLRSWGSDEIMLSMKTWLAGGRIRMAKNIRIGHRFPLANEKKWFNNPLGDVLWNKVLAAWVLFPEETAQFLENKLLAGNRLDSRDREACKIKVRSEWRVIAEEREEARALFVRDAQWLCDRFGLRLPA